MILGTKASLLIDHRLFHCKDATAAFSREEMRAAEFNGPTFAHAILTTDELLDLLPIPRGRNHYD